MQRFWFVFLFISMCVLPIRAEEQNTEEDNVLSAVSEYIGELEQLHDAVKMINEGKHTVNGQSILKDLEEKIKEAEVALSEIPESFKQTFSELPTSSGMQLLERLVRDPNLKVAAVRDLCPDNMSITDFVKIVEEGKRYAPIMCTYFSAMVEYQQTITQLDDNVKTTLEGLGQSIEEQKAKILLKLMEDCPRFNNINADFPLDELISPIVILVKRFGWDEKEVFRTAENLWFMERPCGPRPGYRIDCPSGSTPGCRMVKKVGGIEYAFRWCPAGRFIMNGCAGPSNSHKVNLTRGFWILETEVTQAMWENVMGGNPSKFKGTQRPVENVSWTECMTFCEELSSKLGIQVSLPTEAQWEYACHAGKISEDFYVNESELYRYTNYCDLSFNDDDKPSTYISIIRDTLHDDGHSTTAPVKSYLPNAWGLYDMYGNVAEFCLDWYDKDYYANGPMNDPCNNRPDYDYMQRVSRGGSWLFSPRAMNYCITLIGVPWSDNTSRRCDTGFRIILITSKE